VQFKIVDTEKKLGKAFW